MLGTVSLLGRTDNGESSSIARRLKRASRVSWLSATRSWQLTVCWPACVWRSVVLIGLALLALDNIAAAEQAKFYSVATIAASHPNESIRLYFTQVNDTFNSLQRAAGTHATLYYVTDRNVNAFATIVNGRYIVVLNSGLLVALGNGRDAVAAVMGHELGHVLHNHVQQGANVNAALNLITGLAGLAVDAAISHSGHQKAVGVGQVGGALGYKLASTAYTRDQEREADHESVRLLLEAGRDPAGAVRVMEVLQRLGGTEPPLLFATHPPPSERLASLRQEVASVYPQYEAKRQQHGQEIARQHEAIESQKAAAAEKSRQESAAREALQADTAKALSVRETQTKGEEGFLSRATTGKSTSGQRGMSAADQCTDISPTRRSCAGVDANGKTIVRTCSRAASGEWECKTI